MIPGMGGKGMNPKKMKQMMKQMGISVDEISDVEQVIIRTPDKDIVFNDANVSIMNAQGVDTYQIVGTPEEVAREVEIPEDDVRLVTEQTGVSEEKAKETLKNANGDLAEAIMQLSS
ncbi:MULTISPECIES: nascent polypeptide-associated complex protein [Methanohalophilus]|jgi:nascent polypeptide-associated complex subunit alpha|uniref:Nascent polypeptide-associated complex protein n=1 Tax=Methanohalophilus euhalobius TaxID=51203 RepID=A0A314ZPF1_9EURY|nr:MULTISPECIES: nascent polypeptide-associated complex protein [Methanohalophilus]OBZ35900.1 MAG: nascent polypeptide-associated complex protein [Methanohalophilus sp. DAL1]PQV42992.1 nascent polypeptide associated complex NAC [Methanohalophilus euhalobius]RNI09425.1 nascent polypeptide-associated complex protein [Methanohalophilus euhalobius]RXG33439.1 nascent polypeptide-associated complex subunit alpha [Methanohalophilus sp. WG1-DM]